MSIEWVGYASDRDLRARVLQYLGGQADMHCIDIGGLMDPWADAYVDTYVDVLPMQTSKKFYQGDIGSDELWARLENDVKAGGLWDYAICSNTLEDLRDPGFVIRRLSGIAKAGFICVPNKHTEVANLQSPHFKGYCHHRWIFAASDDRLRAVAKWPILSDLDQAEFGWWRPEYIGQSLGVIWKGALMFEYANDDFPGWKCEEMVLRYSQDLMEGL